VTNALFADSLEGRLLMFMRAGNFSWHDTLLNILSCKDRSYKDLKNNRLLKTPAEKNFSGVHHHLRRDN
jgi:hypothetical protein